MEIDIKQAEENKEVNIVNLSGRIDTFTSSSIDEELQSLIDIGSDKLVCNFSGVEYINGDGLKVFLDKMKYAKKTGGDLKLTNVNDTVKKAFSLVGFTQMCDIYNDVKEAIETFKSLPKAPVAGDEEVEHTIVQNIEKIVHLEATMVGEPGENVIDQFADELAKEGQLFETEGSDFIEHHCEFKFVRKIAAGGMGVVYEVKQLGAKGFEKTVALKTIVSRFSADDVFVGRFVDEARLVANLIHENIVQIYQLGKEKDTFYIVMEYINGKSLHDFVVKHRELNKKIPIDLVAFISSRLCRALEYAHKRKDKEGNPMNIVHRDVCPRNALITTEGVVKLTDFGIAKATSFAIDLGDDAVVGKLHYMAPEQAKLQKVDQRADIFSVGAVMYEMFTDRRPFMASDTRGLLEQIESQDIEHPSKLNPEVPPDLEGILMKALSKDVDRRYKTAGEMGTALEYYMYHDRYGPTNITLEKYLHEIFPELD
ncbi:MAG: serine/threonine protein kinase [Candidatus Scalindua rubra]|uniref:Anti-sigma factor antagonist n=1 Tax=Candidatus Scalindua rubra TaxID=1872076 RepID=A0A1E3XDH4_9BACT|nr:MAG: serine/threonine protein kinase [Candidatus Scalindua rubra]